MSSVSSAWGSCDVTGVPPRGRSAVRSASRSGCSIEVEYPGVVDTVTAPASGYPGWLSLGGRRPTRHPVRPFRNGSPMSSSAHYGLGMTADACQGDLHVVP